MTSLTATPSDVAFSPAVKAVQEEKGSRELFANMEAGRPWSDRLTPDLAQFIAMQTSLFLGTASAAGQPYIQHRGGPAGFMQVLGEKQLGFADFAGNRQYITLGNLSENPKATLFLIDYERGVRVKLWGTARVVENDPGLVARLRVEGGRGRPERAILFDLAAWDANCPQHIPQRIDGARVASLLAERDARIAALQAEIADLKGER
ncbi:pyridoxamine 5'-phosphate oxidase family protein [Rhizobium halophytocola]|uniref:Pyridoxine 5'-phosphate oxidase superfamily flavin-nucleotide-binding protein n=1 Tax=Rhizobium halophytocola TaxID=735519 RepID=A0ABS4E0D2_9HYPH|nr:pyridoxamine 5'-phosphate oxidase family protein [Rhizobium halophytocola]MBP1851399.1 putative pyridoxine 5'-phosphate oxidase superfamily flavin-nucleotide-binding protein [Rhizobium halophytocola]